MQLKSDVYNANIALVESGLVMLTWGNASGRDPESGLIAIKPSGVDYAKMTPEQMVLMDLDGRVVEGDLKPSVDAPTHLALYRAWPRINGIVHTHSHYATCWAQACRPIPCFGTTHADYAHGEIPITECLSDGDINGDYEANTAAVILRRFAGINPIHCPAVLVANHGPFAWGKSAAEAAQNAIVLEELAKMALHTLMISPAQDAITKTLLDKHFLRKHGPESYYGQKKG
jgi:L-ribulose-5-phosphate 4-epimerase